MNDYQSEMQKLVEEFVGQLSELYRRAVTDEFAIARNLGKTDFKPVPVTSGEFLKVADLIVAAKTG